MDVSNNFRHNLFVILGVDNQNLKVTESCVHKILRKGGVYNKVLVVKGNVFLSVINCWIDDGFSEDGTKWNELPSVFGQFDEVRFDLNLFVFKFLTFESVFFG